MVNIVIPMAGKGSRFTDAGFTTPKPLIDINGIPMFIFSTLAINFDATYIFIIKDDLYNSFDIESLIQSRYNKYKIVIQQGLSDGAVISCLLASKYIDTKEPLIIMDCDQQVLWDPAISIEKLLGDPCDGGIVTLESSNPGNSYVRIGSDGYISEVAEKKIISSTAAGGVYIWRHGSDFVKYANQMISKNLRVNNEFYICPVYNEAIQDNKLFTPITSTVIYSVGTPEALENYLNKSGQLKDEHKL